MPKFLRLAVRGRCQKVEGKGRLWERGVSAEREGTEKGLSLHASHISPHVSHAPNSPLSILATRAIRFIHVKHLKRLSDDKAFFFHFNYSDSRS